MKLIKKHLDNLKKLNQLERLNTDLLPESIHITKYNYHSNEWFAGKKAILLKDYKNAAGEQIRKKEEVIIREKMERKREGETIHKGYFCIENQRGIKIAGINHADLSLM